MKVMLYAFHLSIAKSLKISVILVYLFIVLVQNAP